MHLLISAKVLTVEGWHLVLTGIGIVIPVILMLIGFESSRRKDLKKHLGRKADKTYVDNKMIEHEKIHDADKDILRQIQSDLTLIKNHLINRKK